MEYTRFEKLLSAKIESCLQNDWKENHDFNRFGAETETSQSSRGVFGSLLRKRKRREYEQNLRSSADGFMLRHRPSLEKAYSLLENDCSKDLYLDLIAYRLMGKKHVKLSRNAPEYWRGLQLAQSCTYGGDSIVTGFLDWELRPFNLRSLGYDVAIYHRPSGILHEFILEQYRYKHGGVDICARPGNVVIDAGACWGDTALYFAGKVGGEGKVFCMEFIPNSLSIFHRNIDLNPSLRPRINLIPNPLWEKSNLEVFYLDNGPGSKVSVEGKFAGATGKVQTVALDDLVSEGKIKTVDFIKMDIEGAEMPALQGSLATLKRFKPALAIAIYHSEADYIYIINWLNDLRLGYKFYIDHYTIHWEETVLFAVTE